MSNIKSKEQASINTQVRLYMSGPSKIIKLNNDDLKDLAGQVEKNVPDQSDVPIKNFQMRIRKTCSIITHLIIVVSFSNAHSINL